MEITSYKNIGFLEFGDDLETVKTKLINYEFTLSSTEFLGKRFPKIYVSDLDLTIGFKLDNKSIDYVESSKPIMIFDKINLLKKDYEFLTMLFQKYDSELIYDTEGFRSDKLGIGIYGSNFEKNNLKKIPKSIIVYSKGHYESKITPNDVINYYLKRDR